MPFGFRNAPGTYQVTMDVILTSVKWQFALVYFTDISIFSKTSQKHIGRVKQILTPLQRAAVTIY